MKSIKDMTAEVDAFCADKGWRDNGGVSFGERIALLHSEISEALEAWRDWGLKDATGRPRPGIVGSQEYASRLPKPEGVGSEFADVLIRLLDDAAVSGVDLEAEVARSHGRFGLPDKFGEQINTLHLLVSMAYMAWSDEFAIDKPVGRAFAKVYIYLTQLCELHGIDLEAEYERKMAYNRTRPWRHGGKPI